ncbi:MAG TPA: hypothetical protein VFW29_10030 [Solirubrobacteraceae bacterium]|nr:hypothetical protein [Solirubrobacteraceae bacterium]
MSATAGMDAFLRAAPAPQRAGMRALLALAGRPRGRRLLDRVPLAKQAAWSLLAMRRYDDPEVSRALGWDAAEVAERGRSLRRAEGRP